jgi:hypothetical protein
MHTSENISGSEEKEAAITLDRIYYHSSRYPLLGLQN